MTEQPKQVGPGDSGPCPRCGEEMAEKEYDSNSLGLPQHKVSGRYWHMRHEHGILEHYRLIGDKDA